MICFKTSDKFEKLCVIGEGTYGKVYRVRSKHTDEQFALKKLKIEKEKDGIPVTSLRELRILKRCSHPNIVGLKQVIFDPSINNIFLVFEYCEVDMVKLIDRMPRPFSDSEIKGIIVQLLTGLNYLHRQWIIHRDLKLSNLLMKAGVLKICDFGLGRRFKPFYNSIYTPKVVTLWYRAPEVLLGTGFYNESIDMWSVGCIFAELIKRKPLFPADNEMEALSMICELLGHPNQKTWQNLIRFPFLEILDLQNHHDIYFRNLFMELKEQGIDFLTRLIAWNPCKRLSARTALLHKYLKYTRPLPKKSEDMLNFLLLLERSRKDKMK
jgi:cyclin-dependent kinase 10